MGKDKCSFCNKKLKIISYSCRCEGQFCDKHRYTHTHDCQSLQKKIDESKELIKNNNPLMIHSKVIKI